MTNTTITVHTDTELKAEAQKVLAELGMHMSTAINVFTPSGVLPNYPVRDQPASS